MLHHVPTPERLRLIDKPFGWIPFRLLVDGHWDRMSVEAKLLYILLCVVADRRGLSFYGNQRLCAHLGLGADALAVASRQLVQSDLLAIEEQQGRRIYQVLSLPPVCPTQPPVGIHRTDLAAPRGRQMNAQPQRQVSASQVHQLIEKLSRSNGWSR